MHKVFSRVLDCILCVSLIIFVGVFIVVAKQQGNANAFFTSLMPTVQVLLGIFAVFVALKVTKKAYQVFSSVLFLLLGIFQFLLVNEIVPYSLKQLWPVIGFLASFSLFFACFWRYKQIKIVYIVPTLILLLMSCWYFLFSFKIIKMSFSFVVTTIGPFFVVVTILSVISFYFLQKKHKELVVKDEENELEYEEICDFVED
ncbi:MAG: hypothetical protein IJZ71_03715 [Treponema sp.]|nr:hypothetical protein [Treponema sp.]